MNTTIRTRPEPIAPETWLIPNMVPADGNYLMVNSLLIRGDEPTIVDTGAPVHRENWLEQVFSLVEPEDVRWVFLSHDDGDHTGGLNDVLAACPNATLVTNFFATERLALEPDRALPIERSRWLEPGESFDAGDRRFRMVLPPIFDGPATRGLFDERTGVLWAVDSFAALTTGEVYHRADLPDDLYDESFALFNSLVSPWHQWLDPVRYGRHVNSIAALGASTVASAHGPVHSGDAIADAFDRVRAMAGSPRVMPPGQSLLDEIVAAAVSTAA
ncbi:MAG: MBL fold metallo-hydrolase [Pseudonocardia sp.]